MKKAHLYQVILLALVIGPHFKRELKDKINKIVHRVFKDTCKFNLMTEDMPIHPFLKKKIHFKCHKTMYYLSMIRELQLITWLRQCSLFLLRKNLWLLKIIWFTHWRQEDYCWKRFGYKFKVNWQENWQRFDKRNDRFGCCLLLQDIIFS